MHSSPLLGHGFPVLYVKINSSVFITVLRTTLRKIYVNGPRLILCGSYE